MTFDPWLDAHVVATFLALNPDAGSEPGIGWNWLTQLSARVRQVTAVTPRPRAEALAKDPRLPGNVRLIPVDLDPPLGPRVLPHNYRTYESFAHNAAPLVAAAEPDIAHQITLGTPFWGSSVGTARAPKLLGPVCISSPAPRWALGRFSARPLGEELTRTALLHMPSGLTKGDEAIKAADVVLAGDDRTRRRALALDTIVMDMMQDGARPVAPDALVPASQRKGIVWAGRFMPRKAAMLAALAFARALPALPFDTDLTMFGDGPQWEEVARRVDQAGLSHRIHLVGATDRATVLEAISTARALLFSSLRESFGGVVLEAAERATPSVLALHGGLSGLVKWLPRDSGWIATADSPMTLLAGLTAGVVQAATAPDTQWETASASAHAFACENDWDRRGQRIANIYADLLGQRAV